MGSIDGQRVDVSFSGTENLQGADGNNDTFTINAAGKLSGVIDGGFGGTDTIVYSGVTAQSALLGSAGSGSVTFANPNGSTLNFENMEPFSIGGGVQLINRSAAVTAAANKDVTVSNEGGSLRLNINGANEDVVLTGSKVWLYLGDSANITTINSLPNPAGFSLMVDAGEEIVVSADITVSGTLGSQRRRYQYRVRYRHHRRVDRYQGHRLGARLHRCGCCECRWRR